MTDLAPFKGPNQVCVPINKRKELFGGEKRLRFVWKTKLNQRNI